MIKYILILAVFFCSCKKNDTPTKTDYTSQNSALLIGTWKLTGSAISPAYDVDGDGIIETDRFSKLESCNQEFYERYISGGNGQVKQNCNQVYKATTWSLSDYGMAIKWRFTGSGDVIEKIVFLNDNSLKAISSFTPPSGVVYTITNTYTKQ